MYRVQLAESLKLGLKTINHLSSRTGPEFIPYLAELVAQFFGAKAFLNTGVGFLGQEQLHCIALVYLHELAMATAKTFGRDAAYTHAIRVWYSKMKLEPSMGGRLFEVRFKGAQSELLEWAVLDNGRGIVFVKDYRLKAQ